MFGYLQGIRYLCTRLKTLERMKTDIQIARECQLAPIGEIASQLGIDPEKIEPYGRYMAKVPISLIDEKRVKLFRNERRCGWRRLCPGVADGED